MYPYSPMLLPSPLSTAAVAIAVPTLLLLSLRSPVKYVLTAVLLMMLLPTYLSGNHTQEM